MAYSKSLVFAAITLIWTKTAWTFPAVCEPDSNSDRLKSDQSQQPLYNEELYSSLPCQASEPPPANRRSNFRPIIECDETSHQYYCKATEPITEEFLGPIPSGTQFIQSLNYPNINSYPNNRFYIYNFECGSGEIPVIDSIKIRLQPKISGVCVDWVKIDPSISDHPGYYCGNETYDGPFDFPGTNVHVMFRTSPNDNWYPGFCIKLHCQSKLMAEEDALLRALQLPSKLEMDLQESRNGYLIEFDSIAKLVDFASYQCNSANPLSVSTHWNIVKLALQYEKVDDDEVQRAAQDVLQCFTPSQISFARIVMAETK